MKNVKVVISILFWSLALFILVQPAKNASGSELDGDADIAQDSN